MESVISNADTSIQPLVERLAIGSAAGRSDSLLTNDSLAERESATMIFPPRYSYVEPGSYPYILDSKNQTQNKLHRKCQQHADGKKLKRQVLQQTRSRQDPLFKFVLGEQAAMKFIQTKTSRHSDPLEVNRHQPVEEQSAHQEEAADYNESKNKLPGVAGEKVQTKLLRDDVVQIDVLVEHDCVVIPRLSRPEPDPARPANKRADHNQKDPHQKARAKHPERKAPLLQRVVAVAERI